MVKGRAGVRMLVVVALLVLSAGPASAMYGGTDQNPEPPWSAKVFFGAGKNPSVCSGELIAPTWVITAGHCTLGNERTVNYVRIRGVTIHAAQTYTIPGYTSVAVRYPDVGLLALAADATRVAGGRVLPRATADDLAYFTNRPVSVFGYGYYNKLKPKTPKNTAKRVRKSPNGAWTLAPHCEITGDECFARASSANKVSIQDGDSGGAWVGWRDGGWRLLAVVSGHPYYLNTGGPPQPGDDCEKVKGSPSLVCFTESTSAGTSPSAPPVAAWINSVMRESAAFLVPTDARHTGFGSFHETGNSGTLSRLEAAFGTPEAGAIIHTTGCRLFWPTLGIDTTLTTYGQPIDPCDGYFLQARLTDPRWHTLQGVHPGGSEADARKFSVRSCTMSRCGMTGYVLGQHRSECSVGLSATVIAQTRRGRVSALLVLSHICE